MNELITLEQLPVIKYALEQLSIDIKERVDRVDSLIVNEETIKETKQLRASLNKEFNELEEQRKAIKNAIMQKYNDFEEIYKEKVSNLYKNADATLKEKIDNVERELKAEKEIELREFFNQYKEEYNLENIVTFEMIGLNITLSASMKSLKDQIVEYCKRVNDDIETILLDDDKDELFLEYKMNGLDYTKAKATLLTRKKQLAELKKQSSIIEEQQKQNEIVEERIDELVAPKPLFEEEEILEVSFTIKATKEKILKLKQFLKEEEIEYE